MFFTRPGFLICSSIILILAACQPASHEAPAKSPGIYHIRLELGNYWAGREKEIYFDYDSTKTKQEINYFRYNELDSIIYNHTYETDNAMMDSVFMYAQAAIRNKQMFEVDKYQPKDVNTLRLEIIANERMLSCSYNNVLKPSLLSPEFAKLVKMINKSIGDSTFVK
jgi:hypothetical protein